MDQPKAADVWKIVRKVNQLSPGTIIRLGGVTDCFQPCEQEQRVTYHTILEMNRRRVGYLIVTKFALIAEPEYIRILDKSPTRIQIAVTCLDNRKAFTYEEASPPSQRILAIQKLQGSGFNIPIRLSPVIGEFMGFDMFSFLGIERCVIEFLRIDTWIRQWFREVDFTKYSLQHGGYHHLPLDVKLKILDKIHIPEKTICEDVTEHYEYWRQRANPNREDCYNLQIL